MTFRKLANYCELWAKHLTNKFFILGIFQYVLIHVHNSFIIGPKTCATIQELPVQFAVVGGGGGAAARRWSRSCAQTCKWLISALGRSDVKGASFPARPLLTITEVRHLHTSEDSEVHQINSDSSYFVFKSSTVINCKKCRGNRENPQRRRTLSTV